MLKIRDLSLFPCLTTVVYFVGIIHECNFDLINKKFILSGSGALILMASIVSQCYKLTESSDMRCANLVIFYVGHVNPGTLMFVNCYFLFFY